MTQTLLVFVCYL